MGGGYGFAGVVVPGSIAATLGVLALIGWALSRRQSRLVRRAVTRLETALGDDPDPVLVSDGDGKVLATNQAARRLRGGPGGAELTDTLGRWVADPLHVARELALRAQMRGAASRMLGRGAAAVRVVVHSHSPGLGGPSVLVWRLTGMRSAPAGDWHALCMARLDADGGIVEFSPALAAVLERLAPASEEGALRAALEAQFEAALAPLRAGAPLVPLRLAGSGAGSGAGFGTRSGTVFEATVHAQPSPCGGLEAVFLPPGLSMRDALRAQTDFEETPVALARINPEGWIEQTNRLARALLGLAEGESRPLWEVVEGLGRPVADWLEDARAGRALNRPEVLRAILPAQEVFVQITLRRATGPGGGADLIAVLSDATELKSLEARFVQSQKMQAIGQLAGGVAHDFNNLLTAISGHCDLLMLNRDQFDPDYADLVQIHQNANRAAALVRQLLAFSRKQTMRPETLVLEGLLEDLAHLLKRLVGERIALRLDHDPALGTIRADRQQFEQVVMNLVVNARDAMPMGGEIRIETRAVTLERELVIGRARLPAGDYATLRVIDHGIGIAPEVIDKIFEPFFTTKRPGEGTGLGLSTAYGIVKQMGGYIFCDSVEGAGAAFTLYFASLAKTRAAEFEPRLPDDQTPSARPLAAQIPPPAATAVIGWEPEITVHSPLDTMPAAAAVQVGEGAVAGVTAALAPDLPPLLPTAQPMPGLPEPPPRAEDAGIAGAAPGRQEMAGEGAARPGFPGAAWHAPPEAPAATGRETGVGAGREAGPGAGPDLACAPQAPVLSVPLHAGAAPPPPDRPRPAGFRQADAATMRRTGPYGEKEIVLLVEDETPVRAFAARALRVSGYAVIEAVSGEDALELLEDGDLRIDIIVSDVVMPGIDGPGWVGEALRARPGTPVVYVSGYTEDAASAAVARTPGSVFLGKPFSLDQLCVVIAQQLDRARARAAPVAGGGRMPAPGSVHPDPGDEAASPSSGHALPPDGPADTHNG